MTAAQGALNFLQFFWHASKTWDSGTYCADFALTGTKICQALRVTYCIRLLSPAFSGSTVLL